MVSEKEKRMACAIKALAAKLAKGERTVDELEDFNCGKNPFRAKDFVCEPVPGPERDGEEVLPDTFFGRLDGDMLPEDQTS